MRKSVLVGLVFLAVSATSKDQPSQVINWPETGPPVLRFTFYKFREIGSIGNERSYVVDTTAENLSPKRISDANFSVYLFDKSRVRIAEAYVSVSNVGAGETIKFQTTFAASGTPVSVALVPKFLPPELRPAGPAKTISLTVNSVPQGAALKVDGSDSGVTPKIVRVTVGKHDLEFSKEGYSSGKLPLEIGPDDASGGSVSYELGTSAHDTIELRDGTIINGDLLGVTATEVKVRVGGNVQSFERNRIKRILLVEREPVGAP